MYRGESEGTAGAELGWAALVGPGEWKMRLSLSHTRPRLYWMNCVWLMFLLSADFQKTRFLPKSGSADFQLPLLRQ